MLDVGSRRGQVFGAVQTPGSGPKEYYLGSEGYYPVVLLGARAGSIHYFLVRPSLSTKRCKFEAVPKDCNYCVPAIEPGSW